MGRGHATERAYATSPTCRGQGQAATGTAGPRPCRVVSQQPRTCQPRAKAAGKPVTESNLSLCIPAQVPVLSGCEGKIGGSRLLRRNGDLHVPGRRTLALSFTGSLRATQLGARTATRAAARWWPARGSGPSRATEHARPWDTPHGPGNPRPPALHAGGPEGRVRRAARTGIPAIVHITAQLDGDAAMPGITARAGGLAARGTFCSAGAGPAPITMVS